MILLSGIFVKYLTKNVGMIVGGGIYGGILCEKIAGYEPQANKSFLIQQFFKNVGEVQGE